MTTLRVESLTAGYGRQDVLHGTDLTVPSGRLVALLGPSGCGKSTLLRAIAGLHAPTGGRITLGDPDPLDGDPRVLDDVATTHRVPAHRRGITLVPQEAALFPHLDVAANVAFGIRRHPDVAERTERLLDLVGLEGLGHRPAHELSGGQQQRVALARALAPRPSVVLLDEPFSSLDARLRDHLREDVRSLLATVSATALLVTHDQSEALSIADEIAVMRDGVVLQQGPPPQLYRAPTHAWTATFLGDSTLLPVHRVEGDAAHTPLGAVTVGGGHGSTVLLRPEDLAIADRGTPALVRGRTYRGHEWLIDLLLADGVAVRVRHTGDAPAVGDETHVRAVSPGRLVE